MSPFAPSQVPVRRRTLGAGFLLLTALEAMGSPPPGPSQGVTIAPDPAPDAQLRQLPIAILNEITIDPVGADGSAGVATEWVEFVLLRRVNLAQLRLTDEQGQTLAQLPAVNAPKGTAIAVFLGPAIPPGFDSDPADYAAAFASGASAADHLDNRSGGVRLVHASTGGVIDAFYWGEGAAPLGTEIGPWGAGAYFDISFSSGRAISEGESIGRGAKSTNFPGTPLDWTVHGGPNAAFPSPAGMNGMDFVDGNSLLFWSQLSVNQILGGYSTMVEQPEWLAIGAGSIDDVHVSATDEMLVVSAEHSFALQVFGAPTPFTGTLVASFDRRDDAGQLEYTLSLNGTLASPLGYEFEVDHEETHSGFDASALVSQSQTHVTWTQDGVDYPFDTNAVVSLTRTGRDSWQRIDDRIATDYGNIGPKYSHAEALITRLGDGAYATSFFVERDFPIGPPFPGSGDQTYVYTQRIEIDSTAAADDDGQLSGSISRFDTFTYSSLMHSLDPAQAASFGAQRVSGAAGSYLGDFEYFIHLPVLDSASTPSVLHGEVAANVDLDEKLVLSGDSWMTRDGAYFLSVPFYADPPCQSTTTTTTTTTSTSTTVVVQTTVVVNGQVTTTTTVISTGPPPSANPQPAPAASVPPPATPQPAPPAAPATGGRQGAAAASVSCALQGAGLGAACGTAVCPGIGTAGAALLFGAGGSLLCGLAYWLDN